jgi:putative peptide zinc metalloprotease protein
MSGAVAMGSPPGLPALRQDLSIEPAANSPTGERMWVIHDPLQHKFIQIDGETKQLLSVWNEAATGADLLQLANHRFGLMMEPSDIERLVSFVVRNHLAAQSQSESWKSTYQESQKQQQSLWQQAIHTYLFLKVPLFKPNGWLKATLPVVEPLYSRTAAIVFAAIGIIGLYLVSRQWEAFLSTFPNFFTLEGAAAFAIALFLVKALHELGHAYTAVRFGCQVPSIGVAFMVMVPMLYTNVSDAWRLKDRRQRFMIDAAGIAVELALASVATLLWVFLDDGIVRSISFIVATSGWIMSVALNLNPLMRFDGYYLLSDMVGIDNLQPRSFELGKWKMRQILLAPNLPCPETLPQFTRRWMILYAWTIWVYRFILFTGIALLVYHYFFKALGIVLFCVEMWFFIIGPIVSEMAVWKNMGTTMSNFRRPAITASWFVCFLLLVFVPWSSTVDVPAVFEASDLHQVYPPRAAQIESVLVVPGQMVTKGDIIARLSSNETDRAIQRATIRLDGTQLRLARTMSDVEDRDQRLVLLHEFDTLETELAGLQREKDEMIVRAPVTGKVLEVDVKLHPDRWISKSHLIAVISSQAAATVRGYVAETDAGRIAKGAGGTFIPDDLTQSSLPIEVSSIAASGAASIEIPSLASEFGGRIAVQQDAERRLVPLQSQYRVEMAGPENEVSPRQQVLRGVVRLAGTPESLAGSVWRHVVRVMIRESGF